MSDLCYGSNAFGYPYDSAGFGYRGFGAASVLGAVGFNGRINSLESGLINSNICSTAGNLANMVCNGTEKTLGSVYGSGYANLKSNCDSTAAILAAMNNSTNFVTSAVNCNGRDTSNAVNWNGSKVRGSVENFGVANLAATNKVGTDLLMALECCNSKSYAQNERNAYNFSTQMSNFNTAVLLSAKDATIENVRSRGALETQAAKNAADIRLETLKSSQDLARQIAECCCEQKMQAAQNHSDLKFTVAELANGTNARVSDGFAQIAGLITSTDCNRTRDALAAVTNENLLLKSCLRSTNN